ncbi:MAG: calcium/sodium antiporter [Planctomycetota bacterium]|jgi:cation:H+ antiporter
MNLFYAILLLVVGLTILVKGADWLVDGAVAIARHFGMSPLIIGLTIVAMGTSAPEIAASIGFSLSGAIDAAVGNVYGSNVANLALVGGVCAIVRPIAVSGAAIRRDIPLMLGAMLVLYAILWNHSLGFFESLLMLGLFVGIILFMIHSERNKTKKDKQAETEIESTIEHATHHPPKKLWASCLFVMLGLVCLTGGSKLTVFSASYIGDRLGMTELVIGSTIVAVGTSLPELLTCLIAALKGHDDLSVGNLVGSNIFNTLLVIGAAGVVKPASVSPQIIGLDFGLMIGVALLFTAMAIFFKKINRPAGVLLAICYAGYLFYQFKISQ